MKRSPILLLAIPVLLLACVLLGWQWTREKSPLPMRDFVEYWSAGRAFLDGRNPYDPQLLLDMQRAMLKEPDLQQPVMMWNPPWALPLVVPFGLLSPQAGHLLWLLAQFGSVLASTAMLLSVYDVPKPKWILGFLACVLLFPFQILIWYGQIGGFCLLGLAGYLYFLKRGYPAGAGAFAALTALKPHLLFAFGLMLLCDALVTARGRRVLAGGALALAAAALIAWLINPMVYAQYQHSIAQPKSDIHESVQSWVQPLLSYELRVAIDIHRFGIQFVPTIVACVLLLGVWLRHRQPVNWPTQLPWLVLISTLCAAYGAWIFDLVVLLVPILHAFSKHQRGKWNAWSIGLMIAYILVNLISSLAPLIAVEYFKTGVGLPLFIYFTPTILILYCMAMVKSE